MACHNSEILPKLAEHSKKLMKLEEYLSFMIESTQYWRESKYMLKNEIRETFSALSSMLHQREMQLYRQVDELQVNLSSPTLNMSHENASEQGKTSFESSSMPKKYLNRPCVSPPLKLKFEADIKSLEEVIHSFGCLEIEDGSISDDSNYIYVNFDKSLSIEDESLRRDELDQDDDSEDKTEVHSDESLDSFEILPDNEVSIPWSKKMSNDVDSLSLHRKISEHCDVPNLTEHFSSTSLSSSESVEILTDNRTAVDWLRKEPDHDSKVCSPGSLSDDPVKVKSISEFSSTLPHSAVSEGNVEWLKKADDLRSSSATTVTCKDIASGLPFTDAFKVKEKISMEDFCKSNSHHFRSTSSSENNKIASESAPVSSAAKNGNNQCLGVTLPNSDTVINFSSVISKMLGNGNDAWLGRDRFSIAQPLSKHSYKEAITDTMKQHSILCSDRKPFQTEALPSSPAVLISKMFSPYFKNQDESNWLVKNNTNSKRFTDS